MSEPLHEEFDKLRIPFRDSNADLVERFTGEWSKTGAKVTFSLPMTLDFVATQQGPLFVKASKKNDFHQPCGALRGSAQDFHAVVEDIAARFGPADFDETFDPGRPVTSRATWQVGSRSKITVTADSIVEPGAIASCTLRISANYERPYTERQEAALAQYCPLFEHAKSSFGWTAIDGQNSLMRLQYGVYVRLTGTEEIAHILVTEYEEARAHAFSTIGFVDHDGKYHHLEQAGPEAFTKIAVELAAQVAVLVQTKRGKSA